MRPNFWEGSVIFWWSRQILVHPSGQSWRKLCSKDIISATYSLKPRHEQPFFCTYLSNKTRRSCFIVGDGIEIIGIITCLDYTYNYNILTHNYLSLYLIYYIIIMYNYCTTHMRNHAIILSHELQLATSEVITVIV